MLLIFKTALTLVFFNIWAFNPGQLKLDNEQIVQKAHVFGKDDRQPLDFNNTSVPWRALGKIFTSSGACTGTLISGNKVLTAAHCVFDYHYMADYEKKMKKNPSLPLAGKYKINYTGFKFIASYYKGKGVESKVTGVTYGEGITTLTSQAKMEDSDIEKDWALLTLADPIGEQVGWFELEKVNSYQIEKINPRMMIAGYSSKYKNGKISFVADDCGFKSTDANLYVFKHDCDATSGTSGAPLFMEKNGTLVIIAIFSGSKGGSKNDSFGIEYDDSKVYNDAVTTGAFYKKLAELKK